MIFSFSNMKTTFNLHNLQETSPLKMIKGVPIKIQDIEAFYFIMTISTMLQNAKF